MAGRVLGNVVLQQILGFIWYSDFLFRSVWLDAQSKSISELEAGNYTPIFFAILTSLLSSLFLRWLYTRMEVDSFLDAMGISLIVSFGVLTPSIVMHYLFLGLPWSIIGIEAGLMAIYGIVAPFLLFRSRPSIFV